MRKTAWIDVFRLIGSTKRFFITMTMVIALAVMGYTGLSFATESLCCGCEAYYDNGNFYDLQLSCLYGFSPEELALVQSDPRVDTVAPAYSLQQLITLQGDGYVAEFFTAAGTLNETKLRQGTLPQAADECVIEEALAERFGLQLGDTIPLRSASDQLVSQSFTIVGTADLVTVFVTDDYYNRGASQLGDGQVATKVLLSEDAFSENALQRICYLTVKDRPARGSEAYTSVVDALSDELVDALTEPEQERSRVRKADALSQLADAEAAYDSAQQAVADAAAQLDAAQAQLTQQKQQLQDKEAELAEAHTALEAQETMLAQYESQLADASPEQTALLSEKKAEFQAATATLAAGEVQLSLARQQLADTEVTLTEKQAAIAQQREQLAEKREELDRTAQQIDNFPAGRVYATDIFSNPSYQNYTKMTGNSATITTVLCLLLLAIATLVCFTTISRMITEQHRLVGTQKALGFRNSEICGKYLLYVLLCTVPGSAIGLVCSYTFLQKAVFVIGYGKAFLFQDFHPIIVWKSVFLLVGGEVLLLSGSAVLACRQILRRSAIDLLYSNIRSNTPRSMHISDRLPLSLRMTLRNLRSNPQILLTSIISVFGCTVLLIVVLTVRNGMAGIAERQFHELQSYDGILTVNSAASAKELAALDKALCENSDTECLRVREKYIAYEQNGEVQYATLICLPSDTPYDSFLKIIDGESGQPLALPADGVLICQKLAENRQLSLGDSLLIRDESGTEHTARISGVFDRNIGMAMICSADYYTQLIGEDIVLDQYYIRGDSAAVDALLTQVRHMNAYCGYADAAYFESEMAFKIHSVNSAVLLILAITFFLTLFVLSNLSHMNIQKKEREIVIMKVHGFSRGRVWRYVFREAMVMCLIGLLLGVALGGPIGNSIARSIEMENLKNIRGISLAACALGGGVNLLFLTLSNLLSLRGIDQIKMTGSAREA